MVFLTAAFALPFHRPHARAMFARFFDQAAVFPPLFDHLRDIGPADILGSMSVEECLTHYFMQRSLFLPDSLASAHIGFDLARLRSLLSLPASNYPPNFALDANFRSSSEDRLFPIQASQVGHLLDAGATVCVTNLHLIDSHLYRLTRQLKQALCFDGQVGVNCYVSADGAGFRKHFDSKSALVIQCEGQKKWAYSALPAVAFPPASARPGVQGIDYDDGRPEVMECREIPVGESGSHTVTLEPGKALWLPPGAWHEACALGFSLALTFTFKPRDFAQCLLPLLASAMHARTPWRAGIPAASADASASDTHRHVKHYFRSRLNELRDYLNGIDENDPQLWEAWGRGVTDTIHHAPPMRSGTELRDDAIYAVDARQPMFGYIQEDGTNRYYVIQAQARKWVFVERAGLVWTTIQSRRRISLRVLATLLAPKLSEDEVRDVVRTLFDAGVLVAEGGSDEPGEVQ